MDSSEAAVQGVIETIDAAINYRFQLSQLLDCLHESKSQVLTSASQSLSKLRTHFQSLRQCVDEALDERLAVLERAVADAERSALEPLEKCEEDLQQRVTIAANILDSGKKYLESEDQQQGSDIDGMVEFKKKSKQLDLNSLPEIPSLWDTAVIHVDLPREDENIQHQLVDAIHDYGRVLTNSPVQIVDVSERPAALLIKWAETSQSEDHALDLDMFRLQYCVGPVRPSDTNDDQFTDIYQGPNTSFIVRQLQPSVSYSFRVGGRSEGASSWSPWSLPVTWATSLPRHEWHAGSPGYTLSDDNSTLCRSDSPDGAIVYSTVASYICGHTVCFHVHCTDDSSPSADSCVGLAVGNTADTVDALRSKGFLFYNFQGGVFADGQEKTTRLPSAGSDSVITFDTEVIQPNKVRVTIEVNEKIITFDWLLPEQAVPCLGSSPFGNVPSNEKITLFFVARLADCGWSLTVE